MKTTPTILVLSLLLAGCNATPPPSAPDTGKDRGSAARSAPAPVPDAAPAVPERYRGDWAADASACKRPGEVSRLHIGSDGIRFHESGGPIVSAEEHGDTLAITARLTGEGETRAASYAFTLSPDGSTLTDAGGYARRRCD